MATHRIELSQQSLIGSFTREAPPIISVSSGDTIRFETLDAGWGTGGSNTDRRKPFPRREKVDGGHALIGPIFIEDARQGDTLEIQFNEIIPGSYGFTSAGQYPNWQNRMLQLTDYEEIILDWKLDNATMTGACDINGKAFAVSLRPFMGVVGMPPEDTGIHPTWPPRFCGGNIDCKELVKGSKLYLPVPVDGAYLAIGDGHAVQGDGEISCQAIECPMEAVEITVRVMKGAPLTNPRANTPAGWITFGFHEDLDEATVQALDGMLHLMGELYGLNRVEAMALGSSVVDLRITQIVNGVKGVHACLPHGILK
ncbi:acetamidase [Paenibacillus antri]|uniref:Acetamidase n=1 Tax=Paenibacillus antri TaxID=2582848 RepID=A0A5R9GAX0_9BACL|nr:acetamidase/formamidase family protein [Paenibacillus antri]TLS52219.1 acetamidase [Paenibacillus antri]